jgi:uncharacterized protein with von Willebrand factor type A (vWA) domain
MDSEALCREMKGEDAKNAGDIVLLVDRSGSMTGAPMLFARALAAACLVNASAEGRRVVLCMFGSTTRIHTVAGKKGMGQAIKTLGLPPSGGTDPARAMGAVIDHGLQDLRDPDVLMITDGVFPENDALKKALKNFPSDTRFLGLMINNSWAEGEHGWLSDRWDVSPSTGDNAGSNETMIEILRKVGSK